MNLFRTRKLSGMVQLTRIHPPYLCRMSMNPPTLYLPPPVTLSGNHPEPVVHPRMNSRSEQRASHCARTPLTLHTSCRAFVCYDFFVFIVFIPLYSPIDPTAAVDYTAAGYD